MISKQKETLEICYLNPPPQKAIMLSVISILLTIMLYGVKIPFT